MILDYLHKLVKWSPFSAEWKFTRSKDSVRHVSEPFPPPPPLFDGKRWAALHNVSQSRYPIVRCKQRRSAGCLDTTSSSASPPRAKSNFAKVGYAVRDVALLAVVWTGFISLLPSLSRIDCYYELGLKLASLFPRGFCALTQRESFFFCSNLNLSFYFILLFILRFSLDR